MSKETLPDGRIVVGGPTDVKSKVTLSRAEIDKIKHTMYQDFLLAKQQGQIVLGYSFDNWLRDSYRVLTGGHRKADLDTEHKLGKISKAEHDALDELRIKTATAINQMDTRDLDKYGIQYLEHSQAVSVGDKTLQIPTHRKDMIKFSKDEKKNKIQEC